MGIYSRDYLRETGGGFGVPRATAPVCKWLIIINIVIFVLQMMTITHADPIGTVTSWLDCDPGRVVFQGQIWRLLTYAFCHGGIWHILFNMLFLWWFGKTLEMMFGSREFLWFYLTAAVLAAVGFIGLEFAVAGFTDIDQLTPMVGASGAIMAIVMIYAIHYPRERIYIWLLIPIEIRWLVLFYIIFDGFPVVLALLGIDTADNVAHAAHLSGLAFGFLYQKYQWRITDWTSWIRRPRWDRIFGSRRHIRIYHESPDSARPRQQAGLERQVDRILEKISREGEASLSEEERAILTDASRQYRSRSQAVDQSDDN